MNKKSLLGDIALRPLLTASIMVSGLIPIMLVSLISFDSTQKELQQQMFRQLESVRNIKKFQIQDFFEERIDDIAIFSANPYILEAYKNLIKAYQHSVESQQSLYKGFAEGKYTAPDHYKTVHDKYIDYFNFIIDKKGYYDLFLMDLKHGETVFTVRKESDFGIRINNVDSSLRDVWLQVLNTGEIALSDTKPYSPSNYAPAQFLAAPLLEDGKTIGVVAVQISIDSIDNIMKERSGMWESGETYLVGLDMKMRSDSYRDAVNHSVHASFMGSVDKNGVDTSASRRALKDHTETATLLNYNEEQVLSAYTPVEFKGIKWAVIAEVGTEEIDILIADALNKRILILFLLSACVLFILSLIISAFVTRGIRDTINQIGKMIRDVLGGKFKVRGDADLVGVDFKEVVSSANQLLDAFSNQWEEKRKLEDHIHFTEKLQAIGTLAGGIAHDFNNILTSLFALTHIVIAELPENSQAKEHMNEIQSALRRASELVEQILTFGRQGDDEKQNVGILKIISGTFKLLKSTLAKNILLQTQLPEEDIYIEASPSQLSQILMNLCTNAVYAMNESGGVLSISADTISIAGDEMPDAREGMFCRLNVQDTGQGIDPEIKDRIFEPFFTTKPVGKGSGMGLSMVHGIVWNYGGWISVDSELGAGTSFTVYIPISGMISETESSTEENIKNLYGNGEHILFIDDEIQICSSETRILKDNGYDPVALTNPKDALNWFTREPDFFDLIITDLNMPEMDGIELAEHISNINNDIPIILTTGFKDYGKNIDSQQIRQKGITAFLRKPYDTIQLLESIHNSLNDLK